MIAVARKSVSLPETLLMEAVPFCRGRSLSVFMEEALKSYLEMLQRRQFGTHDKEIIAAHAERFSRQAEENLLFQADL